MALHDGSERQSGVGALDGDGRQTTTLDGTPQPSAADARLQLLITYYQCARAEIVQRVTNRDASVSLFLAGSGAVFGVALGAANQAGLLYVIPAFGLAMSLVYFQHDHVIDTITRYLVTEYQEQVKAVTLVENAPIHWDLSAERRRLKGGVRLRIVTVSVLVAVPQAVALGLADAKLGMSTISVLGTIAGIATILFGILVQLWMEIRRQRSYEPPPSQPARPPFQPPRR